MAEFNWWLLIVGLVVGAGLTWMVVADTRRREVDVEEAELPEEAAWLANVMADEGDPVSPATAERLVRLHRTYLALTGSGEEALPLEDDEATEPSRDGRADAPGRAESVGDAPVVERDAAEPEPPVRHVG